MHNDAGRIPTKLPPIFLFPRKAFRARNVPSIPEQRDVRVRSRERRRFLPDMMFGATAEYLHQRIRDYVAIHSVINE